jgi:hypothetical protein
MAQTALSPTRVEAIGSMTKLLVGVAGGTSTSTVVTLPVGVKIKMVLVGGATSSTAPFCATISGNTFTVTHASSDLFTYVAFVEGGI